MPKVMDYEDFTRMMGGGIQIIKDNHDMLSRLDAVIGDGDHGVTMLRAMTRVEAVVADAKHADIKALLNDIGWTLLGVDGGATGPLLGSMFLGMCDSVSEKQSLDGPAFAAMFAAGLSGLQEQTKAKVGDKTMMDALIPAVAAMQEAAQAGKPIEELLASAAEVARKGAESTKEFPARFGRAKHQGERTIGHPDPGATSIALLLQGFHEGLK